MNRPRHPQPVFTHSCGNVYPLTATYSEYVYCFRCKVVFKPICLWQPIEHSFAASDFVRER